jgi:hypothetical protein
MWGEDSWGIDGAGLSLTVDSKARRWFLQNTAPTALERLVFAGSTGNIVFDRTFGGAQGTQGSGYGKDFAFRNNTGVLAWHTVAHYTNAVRRVGQFAAGDLFETLDVAFGSGGIDPGVEVVFAADWDFAATTGPTKKIPAVSTALAAPAVTTTPEPGGVALLAAGLTALAATVRRRRAP